MVFAQTRIRSHIVDHKQETRFDPLKPRSVAQMTFFTRDVVTTTYIERQEVIFITLPSVPNTRFAWSKDNRSVSLESATMCMTTYFRHERCDCVYIADVYTPCAAYIQSNRQRIHQSLGIPMGTVAKFRLLVAFADSVGPYADSEVNQLVQENAGRPKLLIRRSKSLDFTLHGVDFVSDNVDNSLAPKNMNCPDRITPTSLTGAGIDITRCLFCDDPRVLAFFDGPEGMGKVNGGR